jgi:hypothetical protein
MRRIVRWARVLVFASAVLSAGCAACPVNVLLPPGKRALNALKNRSTVPAATDFDPRVTLDALLAPGDDRRRWLPTRAGAIEGYVVRVVDAEPESANCFSGSRLDAHIEIARRPDAPPNERVIVEVTPPMRAWAASHGLDWSTAALQAQLTGRHARIEGWLLFDAEHDGEAENTRPGHRGNWRATAWEVHPVTAIVVRSRAAGDAKASVAPNLTASPCGVAQADSSTQPNAFVSPFFGLWRASGCCG